MNLNHQEPKIVRKGWGREIWHILSADFCVKTIVILKGYKTSYQYHIQKEEVNFIRGGEAEVWLEDAAGVVQKYFMTVGDSFFVPAGRRHRVIALTDLEMFEVSNEYVDDVVRINDEFGRGNGKVEAEHQTPAVLILAAGLGSRLKELTKTKNKALLPVGDRAVISHVIEKYPKEYPVVVAVGYQRESLVEYCQLAHPERRFEFVEAEGWDSPATDPGHSAWACRHHLQRPFYINAVDSLVGGEVPHIDGNWIGVYPTDYPEKYATVDVHENGDVHGVVNKGAAGHSQAFIGVAAVLNYEVFWERLDKAEGHELVAAWKDRSGYPTLTAKTLRWFDTGNLDDLAAARAHLGTPLGSPKVLDETLYRVGNRALKFHPDPAVSANRLKRGKALGDLAPRNLTGTTHFIAYDWAEGQNLYYCSPEIHWKFLKMLEGISQTTSRAHPDSEADLGMYVNKPLQRLQMFGEKYGRGYLDTAYTVNGRGVDALDRAVTGAASLKSVDHYTSLFHGDLHFDNVIYDDQHDRFTYIDWRESFGGSTEAGDFYYDLGKLYAGTVVPFELLKDDRFATLSEGSCMVAYHYDMPEDLKQFRAQYIGWLVTQGYDLKRVKLVAALALLSISPLHTDTWNKVLFFKGLELLHEAA